jgi:hypothetical protein
VGGRSAHRGLSTRLSPRTTGLLAIAATALVVLGVGLIVLDDGDGTSAPTGDPSVTPAPAPTGTLPTADLSRPSLERLAALDLPASTADLLTARLDNDRQIDLTFTIEPADEAAFVEGSSLPAPVVGQRVVTHASPLWELNPGAEIRGSRDEVPETVEAGVARGGVRRAVELIDEDGRIRARVVITPR